MQKKEKHPLHGKLPAIEKIEPDVPLELFLEQGLDQKLKQTAQRENVSVEKVILETLSKWLTKR